VEQQSDSSKASLHNGDSTATAASFQSKLPDEVPSIEVASIKSRDELPSAEAATCANPQRTEQKDATVDVQNCQQNEGAVDVIVTSRPGQNHSDIASEETPGTGPSPIIEQMGTADGAVVETIKKSLAWAKSASQAG
jgi:hypothetical protein